LELDGEVIQRPIPLAAKPSDLWSNDVLISHRISFWETAP
jgi:hypothetical protein